MRVEEKEREQEEGGDSSNTWTDPKEKSQGRKVERKEE